MLISIDYRFKKKHRTLRKAYNIPIYSELLPQFCKEKKVNDHILF